MSDPVIMTCHLALNNSDERAIQFTSVDVVFGSADEVRGFVAALRSRTALTLYARDLRYHDGTRYAPVRALAPSAETGKETKP